MKSKAKLAHFHARKCIWKCRLRNGGHLVSPSVCSSFTYAFVMTCRVLSLSNLENSKAVCKFLQRAVLKFHPHLTILLAQHYNNEKLLLWFFKKGRCEYIWAHVDRTQVGRMLAPWTLLSGTSCIQMGGQLDFQDIPFQILGVQNIMFDIIVMLVYQFNHNWVRLSFCTRC